MNSSNGNIKIVITEDDCVIAADIEHIVTALGHAVVAIADSGMETIRVVDQLSPDLILVDIGLHGTMDGIEVAKEIHRRSPIPVVFITGRLDDEVIRRAASAGARGYLTKPFRPADLNAAIRIAMSDKDNANDPSEESSHERDPRVDLLTERERTVLRLIGEGKRTKEIGAELGITFKTAVTHRSNIMEKLGIHEGPNLVRFAIRNGLSQV
jgi:DNA-binding NarL/FixJ family response regulator